MAAKTKKLLIFDFDGVLADSFDSFYPLIKDSMASIGLSLTQDQYRKFYLGNVRQGFKDFINNDIKYQTFSKFRADNYDKYYKAALFPGTQDFIRKVAVNNILTIASSGRQKNIIGLLEKNRVRELFSMILATSDNTKENVIREILNKFDVKGGCTMITDTVGDVKIAKELGLKTIAVTWGFHSKQLLREVRPDHMANNFEHLAGIINKM